MRFSQTLALLPLLLALLPLLGCALLVPEPEVPMPAETIRRGDATGGCAAVLLPGRWDRLGDFATKGFAEIADRVAETGGPDLTLIETDAHIGYYRERTILDRLGRDVLDPAVAEHGPVWLVGISMGGIGSIGTAARSPDRVAGVVLLAPYLGEEELIDEIRAAGGLAEWDPGPVSEPASRKDFGRRIWRELREVLARDLPVYLGYGESDDLAPGHRLLAESLPPERVFTRPGGHDWEVWSPLWREVLSSGDLCTRSAVMSRAER